MSLYDEKIGVGAPNEVRVVIEIPRGAMARIEYDPELDRFYPAKTLDKPVPANYGWIPETLADDGEFGDIIVVGEDPLPSGTITVVRPLALYWRHNQDHKVIGVLAVDQNNGLQRLEDLPRPLVDEIDRWFRRHPEDHWQGREAALAFIRASQLTYQQTKKILCDM